jgi:aminoglycoside phosphotransferase family enzyme/predicted kinase
MASPRPEHSLESDLQAQGRELRETHISRVFLGESTVYKVKKAVQLGFLDFSTLELRRRFCVSEVTLNRVLAPHTYRGVVPITRDATGEHRIGGSGEPVEWAVEMRRLPDADSAEQRLREGRLSRDHLRLLAERLAAFHASARCDDETSRFGELASIEHNVRENFAQTRDTAQRYLSPTELAAIERWQLDFLAREARTFERRITAGKVRAGHGDLRLEHCYLDDQGQIEIIDCIEFNDRFRHADVCADIAFLSMDLSWHERPDLSEAFLGYYARAASDHDLYALVDFYESYRAHVRGKVSSLLEAQPDTAITVRDRAAAAARKYYLLAEACTREPLARPILYAVGGMIAAGKSTLAEQLSALVHAPVMDADRTRKHLSGVGATQPLHDPAFSGHYDSQTTHRVYAELLRRAGVVLASGRSAILDASFRERGQRAAVLELAAAHGVDARFIECVAPEQLLRARLQKRARTRSVSDGRLEILDAFMASYQPFDEMPAGAHLRLDTSRSKDLVLGDLRAWLG